MENFGKIWKRLESSGSRQSAGSSPAARVATLGLLTALALIFSYVEAILPFQPGIPGIKLGIANLVVVITLYRLGPKAALAVNVVRVVLAGFLFSGLSTILYSLAGAAASFAVMLALKRTDRFSILGVSMAGSVFHCMGQLLIAMFTISGLNLFYYAPVLILSGTACGIAIGILSCLILQHLPKQIH